MTEETPIEYLAVTEESNLFICTRVSRDEWECGACRNPIFLSQLQENGICQCGRRIVFQLDHAEIARRDNERRKYEAMIENRRAR